MYVTSLGRNLFCLPWVSLFLFSFLKLQHRWNIYETFALPCHHWTPALNRVHVTAICPLSSFTCGPSLHDSHKRWSPPAGAVETPRRLASTCSASTQRVNICCKAVVKILLSTGPILTGKWQTLEGCLWWKSQPFVKRHSDQPQVPCAEGCGCREHKLPSQGSFSRVSIS